MIRNKKTPLRSIKEFCLECSGGSPKDRKYCEREECPLYIYRLGHNPNRKGNNPKGNPNFIKKH